MSDLSQIREKLVAGGRVTRAEAIQLWNEASPVELAELANIIRRRFNDTKVVTYLVDRNINYTNVCNSDCSFCAFYRHDPKHPEAYVLSDAQLDKKIEEALELGASRILLQGGHNDDLPYSFYPNLIARIKKKYRIDLNAFSPSEVQQMQRISGKSALEVLSDLKAAGLDGLPGGGAEILDDEVRRRVSPKKIKADEWIAVMEAAQSLDLITTASMVIGFGETIENRLNHLERLRNLQDRSQKAGHKGFNMFISWNLVFNENTSIGRSRHSDSYGVSATEYLKNVALARIFLDNIPHHQASWPTLGANMAQIGLHFGCDDIGSTMMEENVVSQAGAPTKEKWSMSPEELRQHIRGAGFIPAQRDSALNILKVFDQPEAA
ncbi:MAG: CofH family radical SAM protein [Deltaproteobacteria bacterium]|nr:CofH family radical SAM protein [Deltaproteobacteria bacterium]